MLCSPFMCSIFGSVGGWGNCAPTETAQIYADGRWSRSTFVKYLHLSKSVFSLGFLLRDSNSEH